MSLSSYLAPLVVLVSLALPARALASRGEVRGVVVDADSGKPIAGATVAAGAGEGAVTREDGHFVLAGVRPGSVNLFAHAVGYVPASITVAAPSRGQARIALEPDGTLGGGEVIEVTGAAPEQAAPTSYDLDRDELRRLPATGNDALRALQSLPGVGRVPYGLGGLVLRGTSPQFSKVYLDGVEVPLVFHFAGLASVYPSTLLESLVMSPGGGDIAFGRGVGGVVELRARAPRGDRVRVGGEVGVLDASAFAEAPAPGGGAVAIGVRRSYADAFVDVLLSDDQMMIPRYYDGQLRWDQPVLGGELTVLGILSDDLVHGVAREVDFINRFVRGAVRYRRRAGATTLTMLPWFGHDQFALTGTTRKFPVELRNQGPILGLRGDVVRDTAWGHVAAGIDGEATSRTLVETSYTGELSDVTGTTLHRARRSYAGLGVWGEARWRFRDGLFTLKPAVRADYSGLIDTWSLDPRLVVTHEAGPVTLREAIGGYHQPPTVAEATHAANAGGAARSLPGLHASVGADVRLPAAALAAVTAYHVSLGEPGAPLAIRDPVADLRSTVLKDLSSGLGVVIGNVVDHAFGAHGGERVRSWGLETSIKYSGQLVLLWASYTLSLTQRYGQLGQPTPPGGGGRAWYDDDLDQTHNLNLVASLRYGGWRLGGRLRYTTGFRVAADVPLDVPSGRLPAFASLDVRLDRQWRRRWGTIGVFVDVQNVTDRENLEGYYFIEEERTPGVRTLHELHGLSLFPSVGLSFMPPD